VDREAVQKFTERFMQMTTGAMTLGLVGVGDRTGLFASLAGQGPLTLAEIVERTGLQERYLREMLAGLAAAEILRYEPSAQTFELPEAHAVCLADESSPYFMCGWTQMVPSVLNAVPGVARLTSMPDVVKRLEAGIRVADIGCGSGSAVLTMAKAYPASEVTGYDIDPRSVERARAHAEAAGLPNAQFEQCGADEIPATQPFDLITTFDVIHDIAKPRDALRHIRGALASDGTYLMVEPAAGDTLEENLHPGGAMLYAISTLHCMTQSLAHGGEGLGAAWGPRQAEELCREAGFTQFRRLDVDNPFNAFYEVRP
jgi:2-polyprenyl-3-methyl-5-hydroxy-6-metoxy-1,4-benzoquinol methylase